MMCAALAPEYTYFTENLPIMFAKVKYKINKCINAKPGDITRSRINKEQNGPSALHSPAEQHTFNQQGPKQPHQNILFC